MSEIAAQDNEIGYVSGFEAHYELQGPLSPAAAARMHAEIHRSLKAAFAEIVAEAASGHLNRSRVTEVGRIEEYEITRFNRISPA